MENILEKKILSLRKVDNFKNIFVEEKTGQENSLESNGWHFCQRIQEKLKVIKNLLFTIEFKTIILVLCKCIARKILDD